MKRTGTKTINTKNQVVSGGAFAAITKSEGIDLSTEPIDPKKAFTVESEEHSGSHATDLHNYTVYKPSAATARRLRTVLGLPPGTARGLKIYESEWEYGDGWAADEGGHDATVMLNNKNVLELRENEPMVRLRKRIGASHLDHATVAAELLEKPEHERWVMIEADQWDSGAGLNRIDWVEDGTIYTSDARGRQYEWETRFDSKIMLIKMDRQEALEKQPSLNFTSGPPGYARKNAALNILHQGWQRLQTTPKPFKYTDVVDGEYATISADAATLPFDQFYKAPDVLNTALNKVVSWSNQRSEPLNLELDLETATAEVHGELLNTIAEYERYQSRTYDPKWRPFSDPLAIRDALKAIWEPYQ